MTAERREYEGYNYYIDLMSYGMGVEEDQVSLPLSMARKNRSLRLIELQITGAHQASVLDDRGAILAQCQGMIESLGLAFCTGIAMVAEAYSGMGLEIPTWLATYIREYLGPTIPPGPPPT